MTTTNRCWLIRNVICIFLFYINHLATAEEFKRVKRQQVGSDCTENIECLTSTGGSYCDSTKHCACLPTSVNIGGFCWPKINPGQNGCQYNEQCSGVWPGATCSSTSSCICPNNQPPSQTNDGTVCNNAGACPMNGFNSKFKDATTGADKTCDISVPSCTAVLDYDCFCSPPDPPNTGCVNSLTFCCPSRALACIMPKEEGTFSGAQRQNKWWYNSATDNCEQLSYNGLGGNANNFDSKAQCESYCKTACPRGRPAYGPATSFIGMNIAPLLTCTSTSSTTTCGTNYYCNTATTSTGSYCCPLPAFVCGATGGQIPKDGNTPFIPDPGTAAPNLPTRTRYYYDTTTTTCIAFTYNGQGGNYNNFASQSECLSYCSRSVCTAGDPLRDINQTPLRCGSGGTSSCPSRYDCSSGGYCCPTKDFVCNQPVASGSCLNYVQRWYYDRNSGACSQFTYNGCQGNFNNFNTYSACITFCTDVSSGARCPQGTAQRDSGGAYVVCSGGTSNGVCSAGYYCYYDGRVYGCCPTISQTCQFETSDAGTACVTPVTRWYLNSQTGQCATFTYNGCDGNSNNFATQIDCQDYCGVGGCPEGGMPYRETTNGQYRTCTLAGNECQSGYACARVTLTTSSTNNYCCPTRDTICRMSQDPGTFCGTSTLTRYFFNQNTRTCESFTYRGCGGNRNNFGTLNTCLSYCNSAACPSGQIAFQDLANRQLTSCTVGGTNCPSSYTCTQSTLLNQGVCCGSNAPPGTCTSGQTAYMDSLTNGPLQCQQNVDGQCQSPYICQYSATQANSFCCGVAVARCPNGGNVALTTAGQAQQCTPNVVNNCASGFTCQPTTVLVGNVQSATGYCCGTPNPCGTGFTTLFTNNQATTCIVGSTPSPCTSPYACQATTSGQAYCCTAQTTTVAVCAVGKSPLMILNVPTICTSSGSTSTGCPSGYTCDLYAASNSFYCCTSSTATTQRCPAGFSILQPEQTCGTSPDSCPTSQGAFCNFDSTTRRFICCTGGTVVPTSTVCPGGQPLAGTACTTSGQCSGGYTCKPSTGNGVCCPSAVSVCSLPQNVGTTCSTGASSQRYYYNTATRSCSPFTFQGCNGNNNNFATLQSCEDFCMMGLCSRGKAQGISGQAVQTCTTNANCQSGYDCTVPAYGGGSNVCCPSRTTNCNMPQDIGRICATQVTTPLNFWYYNSNSRTCQTFSYNGCGGNGNNFETIADCQSNCASSPAGNPCPSPATAQINPSTNQPQVCNFGSSAGTGCGAQYNCRYSNAANNYYCCSRVGVNGCATGTAYLYPNTQSPLACTQGGPPCPAGYSCVQSSAYAGFQCCSTTAAAALPGNLSRVQTSISCTSDTYCVSKFGAGAQCNMSALKCLQPSG